MITLKNTTDKQELYIPKMVMETDFVSGYETKSVSVTENGTYQILPSQGKKALSSVTVDVNVVTKALQDKEVTIEENGTYTVESDEDYGGLETVTVNVQLKTQDKDVVYNSNGSYNINADEGYSGLNNVNVEVDVPPQPSQNKEVTYNKNGEFTITPDDGYLLDEVKVNVEFDTSNMPFVVPGSMRFGYSKFTELPSNWD